MGANAGKNVKPTSDHNTGDRRGDRSIHSGDNASIHSSFGVAKIVHPYVGSILPEYKRFYEVSMGGGAKSGHAPRRLHEPTACDGVTVISNK